MLAAALLFCKKFKKDLEGIGFVVNPHDPCAANRMVEEKQQTIRFHVDDSKSSHVDPKVNDKSLEWLNEKHSQHGEAKATRGNIHDCLGMTFECGDGEVKIHMIDCIKGMLQDFQNKLGKDTKSPNPAGADVFSGNESKKLNEKEKKLFHEMMAKALFVCKRA